MLRRGRRLVAPLDRRGVQAVGRRVATGPGARALLAAKWVKGKRGWFNMHDVLGLDKAEWRETDEHAH